MRHRAPAGLSLLVTCVILTATDPGSIRAQDPIVQAEMAVTLTYKDGGSGPVPRPTQFGLGLLLRPGGAGTVALLSSPAMGDASLTEVSWRKAGDRIELEPATLRVYGNGELRWSAFRLSLTDADSDRVLDTGSGKLDGGWAIIVGDVADGGSYTGSARVFPDTVGPVAGFGALGTPAVTPSLALAGVPVTFSEPVSWDDARRRTRLLANGKPVGVEMRPGQVVLGLATRTVLVPREAFPAGAIVALDVAELRDPAGNTARWDGRTIQVARDPGSLRGNPGFEKGLAGWTAAGPVELVAAFEGQGAPEGARQAVLRSGGRLEGYLEVPPDAARLTFEATVYSEVGEFLTGESVVVRLLAGDDAVNVLDAGALQESSAPCACEGFGERIGPLSITADLVPFRGRRAILSAEVRPVGYIGMNEYALVLDDVRVE